MAGCIVQISERDRILMMLGSKGLNPHELAHMWMKGIVTRSNMSLKVGCLSHDMRIIGRIVRVHSTEQSVGIIVANIILICKLTIDK